MVRKVSASTEVSFSWFSRCPRITSVALLSIGISVFSFVFIRNPFVARKILVTTWSTAGIYAFLEFIAYLLICDGCNLSSQSDYGSYDHYGPYGDFSNRVSVPRPYYSVHSRIPNPRRVRFQSDRGSTSVFTPQATERGSIGDAAGLRSGPMPKSGTNFSSRAVERSTSVFTPNETESTSGSKNRHPLPLTRTSSASILREQSGQKLTSVFNPAGEGRSINRAGSTGISSSNRGLSTNVAGRRSGRN